LSQITQSHGRFAYFVSSARDKTLRILHDYDHVPQLAHLLLMGSPWIYIDSYIV